MGPVDKEAIEKAKLQSLKAGYRPPLRSKKSQDYALVSAGLRKLPPHLAEAVVHVQNEPKDLVQLSNSELAELRNLDDNHLKKIAD